MDMLRMPRTLVTCPKLRALTVLLTPPQLGWLSRFCTCQLKSSLRLRSSSWMLLRTERFSEMEPGPVMVFLPAFPNVPEGMAKAAVLKNRCQVRSLLGSELSTPVASGRSELYSAAPEALPLLLA
jgi:hypothetical protein